MIYYNGTLSFFIDGLITSANEIVNDQVRGENTPRGVRIDFSGEIGKILSKMIVEVRDNALEAAAVKSEAHLSSSDGKFDAVYRKALKGEKNLELAAAAAAGMSHEARKIAAAIRDMKSIP